MKVASERVGGNLFTHATSEAISTKSKLKDENENQLLTINCIEEVLTVAQPH